MSKTNHNAQLGKIHGIATWLEKAWTAINDPESGVEAVDVRTLVPHLKGLKRDAIPELVAAAQAQGEDAFKHALEDGAVLSARLEQNRTSETIGKSALTPLLEFGQPVVWFGGDQPVADDIIVHAVTGDGRLYANLPAKFFDWGARTDGREILAYVVDRDPYKHLRIAVLLGKRVEYKDPRGFWRDSGFMAYPETFATTEAIEHFRIRDSEETGAPENLALSLSLLSRHGQVIARKGTDQPVHDLARVDVVTNNGLFFRGLCAHHFDWAKTGPYGIHSFVVLKDENAPQARNPECKGQTCRGLGDALLKGMGRKPENKDRICRGGTMSDADLAAIYGMSESKMRSLREAVALAGLGFVQNKPKQIPAFLLKTGSRSNPLEARHG